MVQASAEAKARAKEQPGSPGMERLRPRLDVANALRQRLEQRPGHLRTALDDRSEAEDRHLVGANLGDRLDRRATSALVDQGHLAERIPRAQRSHLVAVHEHGGLAGFDHEECTATLALLGNQLTRRVRAIVELLGHAVEELLIGIREKRDPANQLATRRRHAPILTRVRSLRPSTGREPMEAAGIEPTKRSSRYATA